MIDHQKSKNSAFAQVNNKNKKSIQSNFEQYNFQAQSISKANQQSADKRALFKTLDIRENMKLPLTTVCSPKTTGLKLNAKLLNRLRPRKDFFKEITLKHNIQKIDIKKSKQNGSKQKHTFALENNKNWAPI